MFLLKISPYCLMPVKETRVKHTNQAQRDRCSKFLRFFNGDGVTVGIDVQLLDAAAGCGSGVGFTP